MAQLAATWEPPVIRLTRDTTVVHQKQLELKARLPAGWVLLDREFKVPIEDATPEAFSSGTFLVCDGQEYIVQVNNIVEAIDFFQRNVGQISESEKTTLLTHPAFAHFRELLKLKKATIMDCRKTYAMIQSLIKTQTVRALRSFGFVFGEVLTGTGQGTSLIYRVRKLSTKEFLCAKVYSLEAQASAALELKVSNLVQCDSLIRYRESFQFTHCDANEGQHTALIMPLFPTSLQACLHDCGEESLDDPTSKDVGLALFRAAASLERVGWCHGDIKPNNILLSATGQVVLIDLGAATEYGEYVMECTPGYSLGLTLATASAKFDLNCIALTLAQCAIPMLPLGNLTPQTLLAKLQAEADQKLATRFARIALSAQTCAEALAAAEALAGDEAKRE